MRLFADPIPRLPEGVDLILGDASEAIAAARADGGATLVIADPPWGEYGDHAEGAPSDRYPTATLRTIAAHLAETSGAAPHARLVVWHCWPLLAAGIGDASDVGSPPRTARWREILAPYRWRPVSGGAWHKAPHQGVGYHWLWRSEPVLLYTRGTPPIDRSRDLGNGWASEPGEHSAKPEAWHEAMICRWTRPGDLVLDLYAGLGGVARACVRTGRRYVGAELDPERHARAVGLIAHGGRLA